MIVTYKGNKRCRCDYCDKLIALGKEWKLLDTIGQPGAIEYHYCTEKHLIYDLRDKYQMGLFDAVDPCANRGVTTPSNIQDEGGNQ